MRVFSWFSPAKLNLFLEIRGKRDDGFHELETVMLAVSLGDWVSIIVSPKNEVSLSIRTQGLGRELKVESDNLILRAAHAIRERTGCRLGATIHLTKRVPWGSWFWGGGSSNAATALLALNQLWKCELPSEELHTIAANLGSDINFFLRTMETGASAGLCTGRGERVELFKGVPPLWFVITKPPSEGLRTADVFSRATIPQQPRSAGEMHDALNSGRLPLIRQAVFNRLHPPATTMSPAIQRLGEMLQGLGVRNPIVTGSGSACFAICEHRTQARKLAGRLAQRGLWAEACQSV